MRAVLFLLLWSAAALAQEQVWTWLDEKGEEHYTNDKSTIPEKFRAKARATEGDELSVVKTRDNEAAPTAHSAPALSPAGAAGATKPATPINPPGRNAPSAAAGPRPLVREIRVVLFEASTNSASRTLSRAGVLDKLVANNPGLKLERVEFASAVERAEKLKVNQLPTVLFVDQTDTVLAQTTGLVTLKELQMQLDKARGALE